MHIIINLFMPWYIFNPFILKEAKTGLTILNIFFYQKHFLKNIWRRNVYHNFTNKSPSDIL